MDGRIRPSAGGVFIALMVAACTGSTPTAPAGAATVPPPSATVTPAPTQMPEPATTAIVPAVLFDESLKLADGREISAKCVGSGSPTILLEVGGSNDRSDWAPQFVSKLGSQTTTCLYSRAGGPGSSPPKQRPVSMDDVTSDAYEVLALAKAKDGVEGPYVFVGWSLGGSVAIANALARPDQTVGMAILDSDFPGDFLAVCAAQGHTAAECQAEFEADIDALFMEGEIARAVHPLDLPAVLVTAMEYPECEDLPSATLSASVAGTTVVAANCAGLASAIADLQIARWRAALPEITQVRVEADHDGLVVSACDQIADLILEIVAEARASL